jgi:CBS-domain-containing membrane protein
MIVQEIMTTRRVLSVAPEDDVMFAARLMSWAGVRHLPVCDGRRVIGMFTEHDYLRHRCQAGPAEGDVPVNRFMTAPVVTARPQDAVSAAAELMLSRHISCLPVVDEDDQLIGILAGSDVVAADARASAPRTDAAVAVAEVMTRDPATARAYQPVLEAVALMTERGFKHVPIVDEDGHLVGIVSDRDVRTAIGDPAEALSRDLTELEEMPISTVMTTPAESVSEGAPLVEVAHRLAHESIGALPVIDGNGRVVGIVSYVDVVRKLLDLVTSRRQPAAFGDRPTPGPGSR